MRAHSGFLLGRAALGLGRLANQKMRRNVDHVLCSLPFEKAGTPARAWTPLVGHPFFNDLDCSTARS